MFNPTSGMWSAFLAAPSEKCERANRGYMRRNVMEDWEEYLHLYALFEDARMDPNPKRPHLVAAIEALANCNYVHLRSTRVIESDGSDGRKLVVRDITRRQHVMVPPPRDRIIWCSDDTVNLNVQTSQMRQVNLDSSATADDRANATAMVMEDEPAPPQADPACIYLTKDPRVAYHYANILWLVANQRK